MKHFKYLAAALLSAIIPQVAEAAFTITLNIDNADAVTVETDAGIYEHQAGANSVTSEQAIIVSVNEGYAFTKAMDVINRMSYLSYGNQTDPIVIRSEINTGDASISNNGHIIDIVTVALTDVVTYDLTVVVDDPTHVVLKMGPSSDTYSSANKVVSLSAGENTVKFTDNDKYIHISHVNLWTNLFSVTFDGSEITPYDYTYSKKITTEGGRIEILVNDPNAGESSQPQFNLFIDDISKLRYFTNETTQKELLDGLKSGDNTVKFAKGDRFSIWCAAGALPAEVSCDGVRVSTTNGVYYFSPQNGSEVVVRFNDEGIDKSTFTLTVDDVSQLRYFTNESTQTELLSGLKNGENIISFIPGDTFSVWSAVGVDPREVSCDGVPAECRNGVYYFTPEAGSKAIVRFYDGNVDDECRVSWSFTTPDCEGFVRWVYVDEVEVVNFTNPMMITKGHEIQFTYDTTGRYTIKDIRVNGVSRGPRFLGSLYFNVFEDTEIVFDVAKPVDLHYTINIDKAERVLVYTGYDSNIDDNVISLNDGANQLTIKDSDPKINIEPLEGYTIVDINDNNGTIYTPDSGGNYRVTISEGLELSIRTADTSGIDDVLADPSVEGPVYNLQGVTVGNSLHGLPAGVYIRDGRKFIVK